MVIGPVGTMESCLPEPERTSRSGIWVAAQLRPAGGSGSAQRCGGTRRSEMFAGMTVFGLRATGDVSVSGSFTSTPTDPETGTTAAWLTVPCRTMSAVTGVPSMATAEAEPTRLWPSTLAVSVTAPGAAGIANAPLPLEVAKNGGVLVETRARTGLPPAVVTPFNQPIGLARRSSA